MKMVGNVMRNGKVLARGVTAHIRQAGKRWSGEILLTDKGAQIYPGNYELVLNNGQRGRVMIDVITDGTAYFDGDGQLTS